MESWDVAISVRQAKPPPTQVPFWLKDVAPTIPLEFPRKTGPPGSPKQAPPALYGCSPVARRSGCRAGPSALTWPRYGVDPVAHPHGSPS